MDKTFTFGRYESNLERGEVVFRYNLKLPNESIDFAEKLTFPAQDHSNIPSDSLNKLLESLSLVLGISYWKSYCPEKIELGEIKLTPEQADFWNKVYMDGLGEFFYQNKIDFRKFNLFHANTKDANAVPFERKNRSLLAVGGGKDSIVAGELLKGAGKEFAAITQHPIHTEIINLIGVEKIPIERKIDPKLFEINKLPNSYNGHIPVSVIYHFVGILAAALFDFKYVIFSNEASANYGNVEYLGKEINHQWSKSFEFEKLIQNYMSSRVTPSIIPFSLLRPLHEIKIVELFSHHPKYFGVFSSCNRNFTQDSATSKAFWCGECAKCLFIFACLAAFLPREQVVEIFGQNLFEKQNLVPRYQELLGTKNHKPFDCVGTPEEVKLAFLLAHKRGEYDDSEIMKMFLKLFGESLNEIENSKDALLSASDEHSIPQELEAVLKSV